MVGHFIRRHFAVILICSFTIVFIYSYVEHRIKSYQYANVKPENLLYKELEMNDEMFGAMETFPKGGVVIVYNRVPKTASTTFMGIAQDLGKTNGFHAVHLNISHNSHVITLSDQRRLVENISNWLQVKPALYHGHFAYFPFTKFGVPNPIYINVIREPMDRLVSYFYFLRFGDKFRPNLKRRRQGDTETFDQCIENGGRDCSENHFWLQIPFFCGHAPECWKPGNKWALSEAKRNLLHRYMLVGVTDLLADFIAILESTLPTFFKGATQLYISGAKSHLRETKKKISPSQETVLIVQKSAVYQMEREFYDFAKEYFIHIRNRFIDSDLTGPLTGEQLLNIANDKSAFHYDKIRPRLRDL